MMTARRTALMGSVFLLLAAGLCPALAQDAKDRSVEQFLCKDVVRESGADRDVVIAFLHGFLLGKSGNSKFNLDVLHKQSNDFIERCLDNMSERALDAMSKVKN
jgi:cell division protein FtsW (lipid II flippase)